MQLVLHFFWTALVKSMAIEVFMLRVVNNWSEEYVCDPNLADGKL